MMRWQNCVAFETQQAYEKNLESRGGICDYFSNFTIERPKTFPAFFYLETDSDEPYWKSCSKDFVLNRWEQVLRGLENMMEELKNGY